MEKDDKSGIRNKWERVVYKSFVKTTWERFVEKKLEPAGTSSKCLSGGKLERVTKLDCDRTRGWKTEPLEINILIFLSWHNKKTL